MILAKSTDVLVIKSILSLGEKRVLLDWAEEQLSRGNLQGNPASPQRFYATYDKLDLIPREYWLVRDRAIAALQIDQYVEEPTFKCFLGCNLAGGFVHPHIDKAPPGKWHIRCNLMLSKPLEGGVPIIENKLIELQEGDLWAFIPSQLRHWSSQVEGERKRFICSYGFLVNRGGSWLNRLLPQQVNIHRLPFQPSQSV
jgi:hypothetical protein